MDFLARITIYISLGMGICIFTMFTLFAVPNLIDKYEDIWEDYQRSLEPVVIPRDDIDWDGGAPDIIIGGGMYSDIVQLNRVYESCINHLTGEVAGKYFGSSYGITGIGFEYNNGTHTIDNNTCKFTPNTQIKECEKDRPNYTNRNDTHMFYIITCEWIPNSYYERMTN